MVILGLTAFVTTFFQNFMFSFEQFDVLNITQSSLTRVVRDIREARTGETGAWPIIEALDNSFTFYSDVTNDGKADRVRYYLDGTNLKRGVIEPGGSPLSYPAANEKTIIIASYVDNGVIPVFKYYNGSWPDDTVNNPLVLSARQINTRYVTIYLKINPKPSTPSGFQELKSGVNIRSMNTNL